jgi:hypothetical protein
VDGCKRVRSHISSNEGVPDVLDHKVLVIQGFWDYQGSSFTQVSKELNNCSLSFGDSTDCA